MKPKLFFWADKKKNRMKVCLARLIQTNKWEKTQIINTRNEVVVTITEPTEIQRTIREHSEQGYANYDNVSDVPKLAEGAGQASRLIYGNWHRDSKLLKKQKPAE